MGKLEYTAILGNDFVINEDNCNLSCQYCLTGQSNLKKSHEEKLIFNSPRPDNYCAGSNLKFSIDTIEERLHDKFNFLMLKLTGGEIFLIKNFSDFIARVADKYEAVVLQTNGVPIKDEVLIELEKYDNVIIQVSLDSHIHKGNSYRVNKEELHNKVLVKIEKIFESTLPVEVYTVVNDRSVKYLPEFAEYLAGYDNLTFFPFPIRGPDADDFVISRDDISYIHTLFNNSHKYQHIMPPAAYFHRLLSYYEKGKRTFRCHLPRLVLSSFSDGIVTACPNIWFSELGNVLKNEVDEIENTVGNNGLYKALLSKTPRLDACKKCFTPWDILSMYFDDEISIDELCNTPLYSKPKIRQFITDAKQMYQQEGADG